MGTFPSKKPIPRGTPLGCILKHWKDLGGGPLTRKQLIEYCNHWWPMYTLDGGERWPENGTLCYNTILQLMLFCKREGKWEEMTYVDLFFSLRNHPEWQRQCGMHPHGSMVMALKKGKCEKGSKKCCAACSVGKECLKYESEEEDVELMVAPRQRWGGDQEDREFETDSPSASPMEAGGRRIQPGFRKDTGKDGGSG